MAVLYSTVQNFLARGNHPTLGGTPATIASTEAAKMSAIDASPGVISLNGANHVGVLEFAQPAAATLSVPAGQVVTKLSVELLARFVAPISYSGSPYWIVELFDSQTGATIGAQRKSLLVPTASSLQACIAGGTDAWQVDQTVLTSLLAANALRVRLISPGWVPGSTGALHIDGLRFVIESGVTPSSTRSVYQHRQSASPGRLPDIGALLGGELAVNQADRQIYVGDGAGVAQPYVSVRSFSVDSKYAKGSVILSGYPPLLYYANKDTGPGTFNSADWDDVTADDSVHLRGLSLQQMYDRNWPLESVRLWRGTYETVSSYNAALASSGISAVWKIMDGSTGTVDTRDMLIQGASGNGNMNTVVGTDQLAGTGGYIIQSSVNGGHNHTGTVGGTALSESQLPITYTARSKPGGSGPSINEVTPQTAAAHDHSLSIVGAAGHNHNVTVDPKRYRVFLITRVS